MSKKEDPIFNERVERITMALHRAVPKGSKSYDVVYALCFLLANIFLTKEEEDYDKDEYIFSLMNIIRDVIEENKN